jgi:hypothetical protein
MLRAMLVLGWMVALALVGVSAVINATFLSSLGRTPAETAIFGTFSVIADVAKAVLPFFIVVLWRGHRRKTAALGGVVLVALIGLSVMSGMGFAAKTRSAVAAAQEQAVFEARKTLDTIARREASRTALGAVRPKSVIEQELTAAIADRYWSQSQACVAPASRPQRDHCSGAVRLKSELAAATAAGEIEAELLSLRAQVAALREREAVSGADTQVAAVSELLGVTPLVVRLAMTLGLAVVVELGAVAFILIVTAAMALRQATAPTAMLPQVGAGPAPGEAKTSKGEPAALPLPPKARQWVKRQQALQQNGNGRDDVHAAT